MKPDKPEKECWCGQDDNDNLPRRGIVCPKHDVGSTVLDPGQSAEFGATRTESGDSVWTIQPSQKKGNG